MKKRDLLTLVIVVCYSLMANGQAVPPPIPPPPPPGLPIDVGVIFLAIAGIFYGVKKSRD